LILGRASSANCKNLIPVSGFSSQTNLSKDFVFISKKGFSLSVGTPSINPPKILLSLN
jgi:hypothetical protein